MSILRIFAPLVRSLHKVMSRFRLVSYIYLQVWGIFMRKVPDGKIKLHLSSIFRGIEWPDIKFQPQRVTLGTETQVLLTPHSGEFDFMALFGLMNYEQEVFQVLELRMRNYDAVIEIGANVGVYTIFFAAKLQSLEKKAKVLAFEPSSDAFFRLLQNLKSNDLTNVIAVNCAVGNKVQLMSFYEPKGHLTNGSVIRDFANIFSSVVQEKHVLCLNGEIIQQMVAGCSRLLLKIDVEGSEMDVLATLSDLIKEKRPEIILEVLSSFEHDLNKMLDLFESYDIFNITDIGLVKSDRFFGGRFRDFMLIPKSEGF